MLPPFLTFTCLHLIYPGCLVHYFFSVWFLFHVADDVLREDDDDDVKQPVINQSIGQPGLSTNKIKNVRCPLSYIIAASCRVYIYIYTGRVTVHLFAQVCRVPAPCAIPSHSKPPALSLSLSLFFFFFASCLHPGTLPPASAAADVTADVTAERGCNKSRSDSSSSCRGAYVGYLTARPIPFISSHRRQPQPQPQPSNLQTFKPSNLHQTFKPSSNLQTFKLPNLQTFKPSSLQTLNQASKHW